MDIYWKSMIDSIRDYVAPTLQKHDKCMSSLPNMRKQFLGKEFYSKLLLHKACNQPFIITVSAHGYGGECNQTKVATNSKGLKKLSQGKSSSIEPMNKQPCMPSKKSP